LKSPVLAEAVVAVVAEDRQAVLFQGLEVVRAQAA
jgi:hypothetical protein